MACLAATIGVDLASGRDACAQQGSDAPPADSRALTAPLAGVVTAMLPFVAGSLMVAQDGAPARQRDGVRLMTFGFAAAPWISHSVAGRWKRALVFGLASAVVSTGTLLAMEARDPFDPTVGNRQRLAFGFFLTTSFFLAAAGIADSFIVGPDPRDHQ